MINLNNQGCSPASFLLFPRLTISGARHFDVTIFSPTFKEYLS